MVVARDNDRDDNGEGGDPPVPSDAAASGGGDYDNVSSRMRTIEYDRRHSTHHFPLPHCSPNRRRRLLYCRIRRPPRPFASMPGLGATDPADLEAQACAELGFSWRLEQP